MGSPPKVFVVGLDCAAPRLVFDQWRDKLPTLDRLMREGIHGPLRSTDPPITVPAWASMMTGKDPGTLGLYGFRNRERHDYGPLRISNARDLHEPTVWDILSRCRKQSIVVGVPPSYPPTPIRGLKVGCFLTPDESAEYTYPRALKLELNRISGGYLLDVQDFRKQDRATLLEQIFEMTRRRFKVVKTLATTRPWDFFMFVEIGVDRIHHAFWKFMDQSHPKHVPDSPFRDAILDYYRLIDSELGELLELLPQSTSLYVVSDHGARAMKGGICVNEALLQEGLLSLKSRPEAPLPLEQADVDWSRTTAWGEGGYYSRIFLNVRGREPVGTIEPEHYEETRDRIKAFFETLPGPDGRPIGSRVLKPDQIYRKTNGIAPDLLVYLGDLDYRAIGGIGYPSIHTGENDIGPDDANHDPLGIFIKRPPGPGLAREELREGLEITDVAPTVLHEFGIAPLEGMIGRVID